jgi:hypothetical protein
MKFQPSHQSFKLIKLQQRRRTAWLRLCWSGMWLAMGLLALPGAAAIGVERIRPALVRMSLWLNSTMYGKLAAMSLTALSTTVHGLRSP